MFDNSFTNIQKSESSTKDETIDEAQNNFLLMKIQKSGTTTRRNSKSIINSDFPRTFSLKDFREKFNLPPAPPKCSDMVLMTLSGKRKWVRTTAEERGKIPPIFYISSLKICYVIKIPTSNRKWDFWACF